MFSLFLAAARYKLYVAVALSAWTTLYAGHPLPREAPQAADAIAWAVLGAPRDLPLSDVELVATMAVYARYETDVESHPCVGRRDPQCADGGRAGGFWQLHQPAGFSPDPRVQAVAWVELLRQANRMCGSVNAGLAMTLSGHCHRGVRQTEMRLHAVQSVLQAWNAYENAAEAPAAADASSSPATSAPASPPDPLRTTGQSATPAGRPAHREGATELGVPAGAFF